MVELKFVKLRDGAKIPSKTPDNAGYDVYALFDEAYRWIKPHETVMIPTGLASIIPEEYYFQYEERGSTGTKGIGQRCGVIDSSYRGEWFIPITNHNDREMVIVKKEIVNHIDTTNVVVYPYEKALTQAVLLPVPKTNITEISIEEFSNFGTSRGTGMLGSSGK
jgi:dUTP pyrophosphatase